MAIGALSNTLLPACRNFVVLPANWSKLLAGSTRYVGFLAPYFHRRGRAPTHAAVSAACDAQAAAVEANVPSLDSVLAMVRHTAGGFVDADAPLMQAGVDSLGAVELRNKLLGASRVGSLPSTVVFDHPTARGLASLLAPSPQPTKANCISGTTHLEQNLARVALLGASITLPRGVSRVWPMAATAYDTVTNVPTVRWEPVEADPELQQRCQYAAFMHNLEGFDHRAFSLAMAEASAMDPQQRQLLEHSYGAVHAVGMRRHSLLGSAVAVYIGITSTEFAQIPRPASVFDTGGVGHCFAAGRISYVLGLHGPCVAADTACSSSVVACHIAVRALQRDECQSAVLAGVHALLVPSISVLYAMGGLTSLRGRSHTFDSRADGFGRGEACGTALLHAVASHRDVVIAGAAVRQDGKSASLTAPNGQAQQGLLRAACADAGNAKLVCLEAHGTGTALGDPIEVGAFAAVCCRPTASGVASLSPSATKANVGHTEPAAGMVGMIKLVIGLARSHSAPNAQLRVLNPHLVERLAAVECIMPTQTTETPVDPDHLRGSKTGGVSSFGLGGTIVHAVLQTGNACDAFDAGVPSKTPRVGSGANKPSHSGSSVFYRRRTFQWREPLHAFAQRHLPPTQNAIAMFRSPAVGALHALVADHVVQGRVIFPAAGYLEMARASVAIGTVLNDVFFLQPLAVEAIGLFLECVITDCRFEARSSVGDGETEDTALHCTGVLTSSQSSWRHDDLASARALSCKQAAHIGALYDGFDAVHLQYGPAYRTILQAWGGMTDVAARLRARARHVGTLVHPADLDDALCMGALITLSGEGGGEARLPFAIEEALLQGTPGELWATAARYKVNAEAVSVRLGAHAKPPQAQLDGFKLRALRVEAPAQRNVYVTEWRSLDMTAALGNVTLVVADGDLLGEHKHPSLSATRHRLAATIGSGMWTVVAVASATLPGPLLPLPLVALEVAVAFVQTRAVAAPALAVWLLATATQGPCRSKHGGAWGLARTARAEASLPVQCVDGPLTAALVHGPTPAEPEMMLCSDTVVVPRLVHVFQMLIEKVLLSCPLSL